MLRFPYRRSKLYAGMTPMDVLFIYVKKYRLRIAIILLAVFFGEICATATSYITKSIVDTIANITSGTAPISSAYWLVIITPIISLVANFCYRVSGFTATTFFPSVRRDVRVDFFSYLHSHTHRYFSNHFGGALTNKITTVGRSCEDMLGLITWDLLPSVINILFSLILLFLSSSIVGGVTLGIIILYMAVFYPFLGRARKLFMVTADARSASTGKIADVITNIWNLQSHARGEYEENRLVESFNDEGMKHQRGWRYMECIRVWQGVMSALFVGIIGYLTIWLWSEGKISVGSVVLVFMIAFGLLSTVRNLAQRFLDFNEKKSDIADAISTIIIPYEIEINQKSNTKSPIQSGKVELQNITFAYDDRGNVFENLSLTIPHGQKVGFVGVSGSGKSTLVLLLQRFYDIQSGKIVIDGNDISAISQDELRSAIAVVPQDPVLFHRSLFENIAYGSPDATKEQVIEASKLAHADEFITHLPEWYDAKVGERGVKLSWGQRQRIAIARAILKAAPILLLDEATSALDSESEELIQEALETVMQGKTVIAIAHRLATLKNMDRIIVLEKGKIVEDGTHEELLKNPGVYAYLYQKQVQWFMTAE